MIDAAATSETPATELAAPRPGRPPLFERWHRMWLRIDQAEYDDLMAIAAEQSAVEGRTVTVSDIVRGSINEFVGDFREKRVFATRARSQKNRARREAKKKAKAA